MTNTGESIAISLGNEPAEVFGFKNEEKGAEAIVTKYEEKIREEIKKENS